MRSDLVPRLVVSYTEGHCLGLDGTCHFNLQVVFDLEVLFRAILDKEHMAKIGYVKQMRIHGA